MGRCDEAGESGGIQELFSRSCIISSHASAPPRNGRTFVKPRDLRSRAARALEASFGQLQKRTISRSRGSARSWRPAQPDSSHHANITLPPQGEAEPGKNEAGNGLMRKLRCGIRYSVSSPARRLLRLGSTNYPRPRVFAGGSLPESGSAALLPILMIRHRE
jgi:hypothetical protein